MTQLACRVVVTRNDFILRNHRVHGVAVLPGVAFLDIVFRMLVATGADAERAVIRDVVFAEAVAATEECDREIRCEIGPAEAGVRRITAKSRWLRDGEPCSPWRENLTAQLVHRAGPPPPSIDIEALRAAAVRVGDMAELYARARREEILHGAPMRCTGPLYYGRSSLLAELTLEQPDEGNDERFHLHPAKLDASTLAAFGLTEVSGTRPFIPMFIREFRAPRPLTGSCYLYVPKPEVLAPSGDLITSDYALYDERGGFLAGFTGLTCKLIRHPGLITRLLPQLEPPARRPERGPEPKSAPARCAGAAELAERLRAMVAAKLDRPAQSIPTDAGFYDIGLDSLGVLKLGSELERLVGGALYPTLLFEYSDIDSLAGHLAQTYEIDLSDTGPHGPDSHGLDVTDGASRDAAPTSRAEPTISAATALLAAQWVTAAAGILPDPAPARILRADAAASPDAGAFAAEDIALLIPADDATTAEAACLALWKAARAFANRPSRDPVRLTAVCVSADQDAPIPAALGALARTITAETPHIRCRVVATSAAASADADIRRLLAIAGDDPAEAEVRIDGGRRAVRRWAPATVARSAAPLRTRGVYLITGGSGAIAGLLADHLVERYQARVLLAGRRPADANLLSRIQGWNGRGGEVRYVTADVSQADGAAFAAEAAREAFGRIDGVLHLAAVRRDAVYFRKSAEDFAAVFGAKARGALYLDAATAADELDFFAVFSSLSASTANPGQCDYAAANAFAEAFAACRAVRPRSAGRSLAIGWPFWAEGGMSVPEDVIRRAADESGTVPLPTPQAMQAFEQALLAAESRLVVLHGDPERTRCLLPSPAASSLPEDHETPATAPALPPAATPAASHARATSGPAGVAVLESSPGPTGDERHEQQGIAIIGLAGRYPQAADVHAFWRNLVEGRDCITEVPADRWNHAELFDPEKGKEGRTYGKWGGFLDAVDRFDPAFFGISRREAELMDPQERLFLTTCWHAFEDAGYPPDALADRSVGVFAGVMWNHYQLLDDPHTGVAPNAMHSSIANRVSFCFDLTGPSMAVDTACSSSLTAVHLAVESLLRGDCALALAGGVNVTVHPQKYLQLAQGQWLSTDGRCRSFGRDGSGYVPGEGVGAILLKPLAQALQDGDHVYGVIRASAVNHAGRTGGVTVPSPVAQAQVIAAAVRRAGWDPGTIGYVEAHGTGTALGDPIEVEGLRRALEARREPDRPCVIGSVKSNIGHLESAAGIAAVTKVLLQLEHRRIAPSLHSGELNPRIDFERTPFVVPQRPVDWPQWDGLPRRAGVSGFGAGGANCHLLIEEVAGLPERPRRRDPGPWLFVLSAKDEQALRAYAGALAEHLRDRTASEGHSQEARAEIVAALSRILGVPAEAIDQTSKLADLGVVSADLSRLRELSDGGRGAASGDTASDVSGVSLDDTVADLAGLGVSVLGDVAYTLQVGRTAMAHRMAIVARDARTLIGALNRFAEGAQPADGEFWGETAPPLNGNRLTGDKCVSYFRSGRLDEVAANWVAGVDVPWADCYPDRAARPGRVPLPGYPLREERIWLGRWRSGARSAAPGATQDSAEAVTRPEAAVARPDSADASMAQSAPGTEVELRLLDDGIALITMRAPMFTDGLLRGLQDIFDRVDRDERIRAVVLTGSGAVFSMGGTPEALATLAAGEGRFSDVPFLYEGLLRCTRPVVCAMQGHASGGGLAFGLYGDVVVMAQDADYRANFLSYGFTPGIGATYILQHRFGSALATELMLTGRAMRGEELAHRGANTAIVPADRVLATALDLARSIADKPDAAVRALKADLASRVLDVLPGVVGREVAMHDSVLGADAARLVEERFARSAAASDRRQVKLPGLAELDGPTEANEATGAFAAAGLTDLADVGEPEDDAHGADSAVEANECEPPEPEPESDLSIEEACAAVEEVVGGVLYLEPHEIDRALSFSELGLDSVGAVEIVGQLNRRFGTDLDSVTVYDHPHVVALAQAILTARGKSQSLYAAAVRPARVVAQAQSAAQVELEPLPGPGPLRESAPEAEPRSETRSEPRPAPIVEPRSAAEPEREANLGPEPAPEPARVRPPEITPAVPVASAGSRSPEIAVIGMSGRFPDAPDLDAFWNNLAAGRCSITEVPPDRWDVAAHYDPDRRVPGRTYSKWAALLQDVASFDAPFFNLSPLDAEAMDPQQRLFLEESWRALEDAGYAGEPGAERRPWGVFVGCGASDYPGLLEQAGLGGSGQAFLGNSPSILAARAAYLLNLSGPTMSVDTACSSSLVAVDLACASLARGECELALAGGVAVMATPKMHVWTSKTGMLSPTGRSAPFDERADGIVLGEGVGVVVLKPLARALADGDHVHGVILATGVNGDGRTNGITAPSATAQAELIARVHRRAGIEPVDVGYVEAHGTGTPLGDPIEVKALTEVFRQAGDDTGSRDGTVSRDGTGYCGLGSVKGNIGHTTMAAGIAGLLKVLLALRHRQIPPSAGFQTPNSHLDLDGSPFYVPTELTDWQSGAGRRLVGAVSSFGFSGTNCHVVVGEAPQAEHDARAAQIERIEQPVLVTLSARTAEGLSRQVERLARYVDADPGLSLRDLAFTLATGRRHLPFRAAYVVADREELRTALADRPSTGAEPVAVLAEPASAGPDSTGTESAGTESADTGRSPRRVALVRAAEDYLAGREPDWPALFGGSRCRRVPLPAYPFAGERHWPVAVEPMDGIDPLLGVPEPESDPARVTYRRLLEPGEPLVADHRVGAEAVLPAAAGIRIAVAAATAATAAAERSALPISIRGLRWLRPVTVTEPVPLRVSVDRTADGVSIAIADAAGECVTGTAVRSGADAETLDLRAIEARCCIDVPAGRLYERFARSGVEYRGDYRILETLCGNGDECIATLRPPGSQAGAITGYAAVAGYAGPSLHPAVLDGAIQAAAPLLSGSIGSTGSTDLVDSVTQAPSLPFAVDRVTVFDPAATPRYSHVRREGEHRFVVRIADASGRVCVRLDGVALRPAPAAARASEAATTGTADASRAIDVDSMAFVPTWVDAPAARAGTVADTAAGMRRIAVLADPADPLAHALLRRHGADSGVSAALDEVSVLWADPQRPFDVVYVLAAREPGDPGAVTLQLLRALKQLLASPLSRGELTLVLVTRGAAAIDGLAPARPDTAGYLGLASALAAEQPRWRVTCLDLADETGSPADLLADRILADDASQPLVVLHGGRRLVRRLVPTRLAPAAGGRAAFRRGGVYVIVGGAGGIGEALSRHLASRYAASIAWIGRRAQDDVIRAAREQVERLGGRVLYISADVADAQAVRRALSEIRARFGEIHGVIHAALVLRDRTLAAMSEAELEDVLAPKTAGVVTLADAVRGEPLDFLAYFSTALSFAAAPGQGNYAAASAFEDAYALALRARGLPALVLNWGFWGSVGAVAGPAYRERFKTLGIEPIEVEEGVAAAERVLAAGNPQTLIVKGTPDGLRRLGVVTEATERTDAADDGADDGAPARLEHATRGYALLDEVARWLLRQRLGTAAAARRLHVVPDQRRLFDALIDLLERAESAAPPDAHAPAESADPAEALAAEHPELAPHLRLLRRCVDALPDVLSGTRSGVEVLFPRGSADELAAVYQGNAGSDFHHRLLADEVARRVRAIAESEGRAARVLEIGAGTGSGTAFVLRACAGVEPAPRIEFTDVSAAFLTRARQEFGARHPNLDFRVLDVEQDLQAQGFAAGAYDIVLAGNVLHAVADLAVTLRRIRDLLSPGSLLLVNEVTRRADFLTLTFGLTAGWWRFGDPQRRIAHAPLLTARQWRAAVTEAGLSVLRVGGIPGVAAERLEQCVLAAEAPRAARNTADGPSAAPVPPRDVKRYVKRIFAQVLKFAESDLADDAQFDSFGIDSLVSLSVVDRFSQDLGDLPATLLFEHQTISALAGHFAATRAAELAALLGAPAAADGSVPTTSPGPVPAPGLAPAPGAASATTADPVAVAASEPLRPPVPGPAAVAVQDIAVIGVTGRYPGSPDLETFWANLVSGANCVTEVPAERWDWREHFDPRRGRPQHSYSRWGGFLDGVDLFDPGFFGILPRDAAAMDPQERLFLETAWTLLQDAGYLGPHTSQRSIGVFVGTMYGSYGRMAAAAGWPNGRYNDGHSSYWSIANRVSYTFDLRGPSFAVDSACSSSLTAVHLAVESLRRGECRMAVAGGVNLLLHPAHLIALSSMNMLSADGECKVFDERADGFVPGEGVGAVLLKPLDAAVADGDDVWAVIKGSHLNAGGRTAGYTVPNPNAQAELVVEALRRSGIDPRTLGYVEAHGTGTSLGDPIELAGLTRALREAGAPRRCAVGSVKANIGHLEGAAGIAGLTKVLLQLRHDRIAPCVNLRELNSKIELGDSPLYLPAEATAWPGPLPRRAGISSFGAGGANAHLILEGFTGSATRESASPGGVSGAEQTEQLVLLSARTREQLRAMADDLARFVEQHPDTPLADIARTTQVGRAEYRERLAVSAHDGDQLALRLRSIGAGGIPEGANLGTAAQDLLDGPAGEEFVRTLMVSGDRERLGRLWVNGASIDFRPLWPAAARRRIALPLYPFDRRRFWLPQPQTPDPPAANVPEEPAGEPAQAREAESGIRYLRRVWRPGRLAPQPLAQPGTVLILGRGPLADALAERIAAAESRVVTASATDPDELRRLAAGLAAKGHLPDAMALAVPWTAARAEEGFPQLLWAATAILAQPACAGLRVVVGVEPSVPRSAALAAPLRTLALENSGFAAVTVSCDEGPDGMAARMFDELRRLDLSAAPEQRAIELRYAAGARSARELEPFAPSPAAAVVRPAGVYLITGGNGALGRLFARHLTAQAPVTVVLAGRSALDPAALDELAALAAAGSRIVYERADVGDGEQVRSLIDRIVRGHGPINGLIHAAGVTRDGLAARKTPQDVADVLGPKLTAACLLDEATADQPLDFVVYFSSIAARSGNLGQADYAYANAFLDEFAAHREQSREAGERSGRTVSICWPLWEEGGMSAGQAARRLFARRWGSAPLNTADGLRAFDHALGSAETCVVVDSLAARGEPPVAAQDADEQPPADPVLADPVPAAQARRRVPLQEVESLLRRLASGFLLVEERHVDLEADLMDAGFDSISLTELVADINEHYDVDLLPTVLFECATLAAFARYLVEEEGVTAGPEPEQVAPDHPAPGEPAPSEPTPAAQAGDPAGAARLIEAARPAEAVEAVEPVASTGSVEQTQPAAAASPGPSAGAEVTPAHAAGVPAPASAQAAPTALEPVAVVGIAGTFPGSRDLDEFWRHLAAGDDLIRDVPEDRTELLADPRTRAIRAGFLDDVRGFDAALFGISPREASLMDPQQRLFLQTVWRAIEDAGYPPSALAGTETGLFAGVAACDYDDLLREHRIPIEAHTASGVAGCILANRVSHLLDLRGPSEAVDTACSSALVAVHRAVRAVQTGECGAALAGGVNVLLSPGLFVAFDKSGMLSADGRCKTFDENADGYGRGEGVGVVFLKPLRRAIEDRDHVYAVIRGSAVNHGGHATSLTAPNPAAQARVIAAAHRAAGVDPASIGYIEAHGTGTRLGDPIEIEGLKKAFTDLGADGGAGTRPWIAIGSVKTNIGHLEAAAGIAGLIKVLLCFQHGQLPPTINLDRPNPYLRLQDTPFFLNDRLRPWPADPVRRAGVSSFGFGGTNAHVVLESAPELPQPPMRAAVGAGARAQAASGPLPVLLSAPSAHALGQYAGTLADYLAKLSDEEFPRFVDTLRFGREALSHRVGFAAEDREDAVRLLRAAAQDEADPQLLRGVVHGRARRSPGPEAPASAEPASQGPVSEGPASEGPASEGLQTRAAEPDLQEQVAAWVAGKPTPWSGRTPAGLARLAGMPVFPFARTPHWFTRELPAEPNKETTVQETDTTVVARPKVRLAPATREPADPAPRVSVRTVPVAREAHAEAAIAAPPAARPEPEPAPAASPAAAGGAPAPDEAIREQLASVLGLAPRDVADDCPFAQLGLDSILRMELVRRLNETLGGDLKAADLYEFDTVRTLSAYLNGPAPKDAASHAAPQLAPAQPIGPASSPVFSLQDRLLSLVTGQTGRPFDPRRTFQDNGFTSFDMLRTVSTLEKRLGTMPKTLLFDQPTIEAVAAELTRRFGDDAVHRFVADADEPAPPTASPASVPAPATAISPASSSPDAFEQSGADVPIVVLKRSLPATPHLARIIAELDRTHAKEGGLAGRDIAPLAFLGSARAGYFNISVRDDVLFSWSYVGSAEYFAILAGELFAYARAHGLRPNLLSLLPLDAIAGEPVTATPFGAVQRLENLAGFSLRGGKMSRLRYMVGHFEKAGACRTYEYRCGDDPETDRRIVGLLDRWADGKQMVNPYVAVVREEIANGRLAQRHRLFLTCLDEELANAIIITRIPSEPGYLMDLEFYPPRAPLGGLEYAIVQIIAKLVDEGCSVFSFGASFGVAYGDSANAAPEAQRSLAELRSAGIFGEGNFQFKNKFRPVNVPIYLCQPTGADRTPVSEVILMIADPSLVPVGSQPARDDEAKPHAGADQGAVLNQHAESNQDAGSNQRPVPDHGLVPDADTDTGRRSALLSAHGWNPLALAHAQVGLDLVTDSWAELDGEAVRRRGRELADRAQAEPDQSADIQGAAIPWLPFPHRILTGSGRSAEALLCRAWPRRRGSVLHNGLFPTWYGSLIEGGFTPEPVDRVHVPAASGAASPFAGDLNLDRLAAQLAERPVSFVCVELSCNAAGGYPVSLANLRAVRRLAEEHGVPIVLDAARVMENAVFIAAHEEGQRGRDPWQVVRDLLATAQAAVISLPKDFGVEAGGLLACGDAALARAAEEHVGARGRDITLAGRRLAVTALRDTEAVAAMVRERMAAVGELWSVLHDAGLPVLHGPGGHCVLLDVSLLPAYHGYQNPVMSCLAWIFAHTGVRGGPHLSDGPALGQAIRFAVPLGLDRATVAEAARGIAALLTAPGAAPDLIAAGDPGSPATMLLRPAAEVPADVAEALREGHAAADDNAAVLREHCPEVERRVLRFADGEVETFTAGRGPTLLLLAPFNIGAGLFAAQFAGLHDRFRIVAVHHPGVGASAGIGDLTLDGIADLAERVLAELGAPGPAHVAGASFGGLAALSFALRHPQATASLCLIGSSYKIGNRIGEINRLDVVAREDFDAVQAAAPERFRERRAALERQLLRCESMDPRTGLRYLDVFAARPNLLARLSEIGVPTLIIQGLLDTVVPVKAAHVLYGAVPDARYVELADAGHFPCLTHADEVNALLAERLR